MQKFILNSLVALALIVPASAAMATVTISGQTSLGSSSFTPSAKVGISITATASAYAATSCHLNGTYEYGTVGGTGTTQDPSKIYSATIPSQSSTATVGAPDATTTATALPTAATWQ